MIQFFKDSVRELKHVVWPTRAQTQAHFVVVVLVLIFFGIYLYIASLGFSEGLFALKDFLTGGTAITDVANTSALDLNDIQFDAITATGAEDASIGTPVNTDEGISEMGETISTGAAQ